MYKDVKELTGYTPFSHSGAFGRILFQPGSFFYTKDIKDLKSKGWSLGMNSLIDKILKEKFKDYIKPGVKFNFYWTKSSHGPDGVCTIGIWGLNAETNIL